ncbi:MAG: flagellar protein FlaG [Desulfobacterales bacterium]|nr:flagellar protein FlaG [Desulfobacterales bacterium]
MDNIIPPVRTVNITPVKTVKTESREQDFFAVEDAGAPATHTQPDQEPKPRPEVEISQALLDELQREIQMMRNIGLQFSVHEATGRTVIKVIDKETEKLIREIPPEELLKLAAKIEEMIGILLDKKV